MENDASGRTPCCGSDFFAESEFEQLAENEIVALIVGRLDELRRAGCDDPDCIVLASRADVDLGQALGLLTRGCSARLTLRILV